MTKVARSERAAIFAVPGVPGLYRVTQLPITEAGQGAAVLATLGEGGPRVFARDDRLERAVTAALGAELVSALDRYVCDCGARTPLVSVTPAGLECPRCKPVPG